MFCCVLFCGGFVLCSINLHANWVFLHGGFLQDGSIPCILHAMLYFSVCAYSIAVLFGDFTDTAASQLKFYFELSTAYFNIKQRVSYAVLYIVVIWVISSKEEKIRKYKGLTKTPMGQYLSANLNATGKSNSKDLFEEFYLPSTPSISLMWASFIWISIHRSSIIKLWLPISNITFSKVDLQVILITQHLMQMFLDYPILPNYLISKDFTCSERQPTNHRVDKEPPSPRVFFLSGKAYNWSL